ncbi:CCA tRNA nucleotidyltransferase [uncultured Sulfitobacter sp.]|uniref:CCA tRNA nucleotidyltransferase n=1 Tax=uncultured Sulfitobacter sp. TaxID=191468 RepID=UPI002605313C|nr:CCA tRNA nucleotidyltransferase [uncultured Sulfitobacter sp.]
MDRDYSKIASADAPWLSAPSAQAVCDAIVSGGHQIFYVGGCVRNALLGAPVSDVDMSTNATPQQVTALTKAAGLKPVPTGIDHGTITVVSSGTGYEVTTFRRDVETDGRRAVVAFSNDITDDARRRDFTMNALYADSDGNVLDPLGGLDDLRARRVRFIEDADQRIREDYLRTLRYFRFHAWYGDTSRGMDADALAAISGNLDGLETLSAERIGAELSKLLSAPNPSTALASMSQTGVLGTILPGADVRFVMLMIHSETMASIAPNWIGRLVALGGEGVPTQLRLSKVDQRMYDAIKVAAFEEVSLAAVAFEYGEDIAVQAYLIRCAIGETLPDAGQLEQLAFAARQEFPVKAADLIPKYQGAELGSRLSQLKTAWIASGFAMSKQDLLSLPAP